MPDLVRYGVHGITVVEFVGESRAVLDGFARRWGSTLGEDPGGPADVVVERCRSLEPTGPVRLIGDGLVGFDDDAAYWLDRSTGAPVARVDFSTAAPMVRLQVVDGAGVAHLLELVLLAFERHGWGGLHGSAVELDGTGVVTMGWPKGGKTSALLSFMAAGARFVGDEWVLVDDRQVLALPTKLSVSEWQLPLVPALPVSARQRMLFRSIRAAEAVAGLTARAARPGSMSGRLATKARPVLRRQRKVSVPADEAFAGRVHGPRVGADVFFTMIAHDDDEIVVRAADPAVVADQMTRAGAYELRDLFALFEAQRFACGPDAAPDPSVLVERQHTALTKALDGRPVFHVFHRYGAPTEPLFAAMAPYCS